MAALDFEVTPAGAFARAFPLGIGVLMFVGLVVTLVLGAEEPKVLLGAVPAIFVGLAVVALLAWAIRHPRVRYQDGTLEVGRFPRLRARPADLDLDAARILDLDTEPGLRSSVRLFGTSLPGFHAGWFWMKNGSRAFLLVTDRKRVLLLPRRAGGPVLLSLRRPEALLDALRRARG